MISGVTSSLPYSPGRNYHARYCPWFRIIKPSRRSIQATGELSFGNTEISRWNLTVFIPDLNESYSVRRNIRPLLPSASLCPSAHHLTVIRIFIPRLQFPRVLRYFVIFDHRAYKLTSGILEIGKIFLFPILCGRLRKKVKNVALHRRKRYYLLEFDIAANTVEICGLRRPIFEHSNRVYSAKSILAPVATSWPKLEADSIYTSEKRLSTLIFFRNYP